jgi:hypothetical protein
MASAELNRRVEKVMARSWWTRPSLTRHAVPVPCLDRLSPGKSGGAAYASYRTHDLPGLRYSQRGSGLLQRVSCRSLSMRRRSAGRTDRSACRGGNTAFCGRARAQRSGPGERRDVDPHPAVDRVVSAAAARVAERDARALRNAGRGPWCGPWGAGREEGAPACPAGPPTCSERHVEICGVSCDDGGDRPGTFHRSSRRGLRGRVTISSGARGRSCRFTPLG